MNRRHFVKTIGAAGIALIAGAALPVQPARAEPFPLDLSSYPVLYARKGPNDSSDVSVHDVNNLSDETEPSARIAQMIIVGDTSYARGVADVTAAQGMDYPLSQVTSWLKAADFAVGNYEGVIAPKGTGAERSGSYRLHTLPDAAPALARGGFGLLNIANNHTMDLGPAGLKATFQVLHDQGIMTIGAGSDGPTARTSIRTTINGVKIAWLSFTLVPDPPDNDRDREDGWSRAWFDPVWGFAKLQQYVEEARGSGEVLIVQFHWGNEYAPRPKNWELGMARATIDAGAALVVGHHPHVVQGYEIYKDTLVAYSLGNFLFDQLRQPGLALWVRVDQRGIIDVHGLTLIPGVNPRWNPPVQSAADIRALASAEA